MPRLLPHAIDRAAARDPDREAVRCGGEALTYAGLVERADRLARVLAEGGVRRGDRVGVLLNKGLRAAVAVYGAMKAGAAYVPLDPSAPPARLAFIVRDCGIRHLVTDASRLPALRRLRADGVLLDACVGVEEEEGLPGRGVPWDAVEAAPPVPPDAGATERDLAYVLYTSGSTGMPKGVVHTHRSALAWAGVAARTYGLRPDDRLSNHAPLHFDLSTLDYFGAAVAGATTVVVPEAHTKLPAALSRLMEEERLTVLYVVPLALTQLLLHGALDRRDLGALRWVLFGGEPLAPKHLRALMAAWPHARFCNVYGPTEVNGVTYHLVPPDFVADESDEPVPIGRPYANVEALVVDAEDRPVEPGVAGELLVRSPTMMRGYWGRPDLDAKAFFRRRTPDPPEGVSNGGVFPEDVFPEDVFHRTGDLVRQRADGAYHFLGRKDRQVKARGYRVELAEVEAALATHEAVVAAAAFAVPDGQGSQRIEAAVTVRDGAGVAPDDLRRHAAAHLPAYAVPAAVALVDGFPETSTGKIDRLALQARAVSLTPEPPP